MKTELTQILNSVKNGSMTVEEADLKLKSSRTDDRTIMEMVIAKMITVKEARIR